MTHQRTTIVVNFFGGPWLSSGKSTLTADVFAQLKWADVNCEMALEFIKESVWEDRRKVFNDQLYVFGQQHYRLHRLLGEVDVILTDSPLVLSCIYKPEGLSPLFDDMALDVFNSFNNVNFFVERYKLYNPKGRLQTQEEAIIKDQEIRNYMDGRIKYTNVKGNHDSAEYIAGYIINLLGKKEI